VNNESKNHCFTKTDRITEVITTLNRFRFVSLSTADKVNSLCLTGRAIRVDDFVFQHFRETKRKIIILRESVSATEIRKKNHVREGKYFSLRICKQINSGETEDSSQHRSLLTTTFENFRTLTNRNRRSVKQRLEINSCTHRI